MAKSPEITVILVRCASTEWDDAGRLQGSTDLPLGDRATAAFIASTPQVWTQVATPPAVIYSASDEGSIATARLLAEAAPVGPIKVKPIAGLDAIDLGLWQGLLAEEVEQRYPRKFKGWQEDPTSACAPEGEPIADGQARLLAALNKLAEKATGPLVVVLRPLEHAMVSLLLAGDPPSSLIRVVEEGPPVYRGVHPRAAFRELLGTIKAVA
ncbi:MAG: histidine phosphatase family protein [Planctomycetota bacterium]